MTAKDKQTIYTFLRTASSAMSGYVPSAFLPLAPAFEDDRQPPPTLDRAAERIRDGGLRTEDGAAKRSGDSNKLRSPLLEGGRVSPSATGGRQSGQIGTAQEGGGAGEKGGGQRVAGSEDGASSQEQSQNDGDTSPLTMETIARRIAACTLCPLCKGRTYTVPGIGAETPIVFVVGEGPGHEEDISGLPFVGPAGKLLDKMLGAISLNRYKNCYISNAVKCRPPNNRTPTPSEAAVCLPFLEAQIHVLNPKFILVMGRTAAMALLGTTQSLASMRGRWYTYGSVKEPSGSLPDSHGGIPLYITYHPSALLRNSELKRPAWEDLKAFRARLLQECPGYEEGSLYPQGAGSRE